jgi:hypothetical protein
MSFAGSNAPIAPDSDLRSVFERLFGGHPGASRSEPIAPVERQAQRLGDLTPEHRQWLDAHLDLLASLRDALARLPEADARCDHPVR